VTGLAPFVPLLLGALYLIVRATLAMQVRP